MPQIEDFIMATYTASRDFSAPKTSSMFFDDARTCKEWLKAIPLTNIAQAQQSILDALRMMNRSNEFAPIERLTVMELLRDTVAYLLGEQRTRFVGKTIPLATTEYTAWHVSRTLVAEMEEGYRRCWVDVVSADENMAPHAALIIQRTIRYIGLQMLLAGFIYRRFDTSLWMRLHSQWMEAEQRGLTEAKVKDSVGSIDGYSSVAQAYTAVVLGQLANVHELSSRQIDFVDAIMKRFGQKVSIVREAAPNAQGLVLGLDLLANTGAAFSATASAQEHVRFMDMTDISRSLRRRMKKLVDGEDPAAMDLPGDWKPADAREQLLRLHLLWCEGRPPRGAITVPNEKEAVLCFGIGETHFMLTGDLFGQPDVKRELSRQEMNDLAMFGKVSEATIRAKYADFNYGTETWGIIDESRGAFRLLRPSNSPRGVAIGKLVGMKIGKDNPFYLGVIREIVEDPETNITVTISILPGKPEATSVRSGDLRTRGSLTYVQGFRLPAMEALKIPETLIVPTGLAQRGRGIDVFYQGHGTPKQVTLYDFVERGMDFDRVSLL
jgi:cyclic-di-GMP-binding protein